MNTERRSHLSELASLLPLLSLVAIALLSFTPEQRKYIHERDEEFGIRSNRGGCQAPFPHPCNGDKATHVHHLIPQRYAKEFGIDPDFVENGITLCEYSHTHYIHPDITSAKHNYHIDKQSYQQTFQARAENLKKGKIYWVDQWDRVMHTIIIRNEQAARKAGKVPPEGKNERTRSSTSHD